MFHFFGKGGCFSTSLEKEVFSTMAKRLRGWQLEIETGRTKQAKAGKALEKAEGCVAESVLANKLLFLWARGTLSATLIRELADCAIQDGAQHTDLVAIAQTGNWGAQPGNVHRQILNHFCSNVQLAASHDVEVPCTHPKTSKDALEKASVFLPHMMFYCFIAWVKATQKYFSNSFALEKASWQASGKELPKQKMKN